MSAIKLVLRSMIMFVVAFAVICPLNSFADSGSELEEIVLKIDGDKDTYISGAIMEFNKPGDKILRVENHLSNKIKLVGLSAVLNETNILVVANGFSFKGPFVGEIIEPDGFCTFVITAHKNAAPTLNKDGHPVFLNYSIGDEKEHKNVGFRLKSEYNNHIVFENVDVEFIKTTKKYVLSADMKNETEIPLEIKDIKVMKGDESIGELTYENCGVLQSGNSCKVKLTIESGDKHIDEKNGEEFPLLVGYDLLGSGGKKESFAAISVVKFDPVPKKQKFYAVVFGLTTTGSIVLPLYLLGESLSNYAGEVLANVATYLVIGGLYKLGAKLEEYVEYDNKNSVNMFFNACSLYFSLERFTACGKFLKMGKRWTGLWCVLLGVIPNRMLVKYSYKYISERLLYPEDKIQDSVGDLPKEKSVWQRIKPAVDFAVVAVGRVGLKKLTGKLAGYPGFGFMNEKIDPKDDKKRFKDVYGDWSDVIYDPLSAYLFVEYFKQEEPELKSIFTAEESEECGQHCVCGKFRPSFDDVEFDVDL